MWGRRLCVLFVGLLLSASVFSDSIGTEFTYQGELEQAGEAASGDFDFLFNIYNVDTAGFPLAGTVTLGDVPVEGGVFSVPLDFGALPFTEGQDLWLAIAVREGASDGAYTPLDPRQKLTPTPYAIRSTTADKAESVVTPLELGGSATLGNGVITVRNFADDGVGLLGEAYGDTGRTFGLWGFYSGTSTQGAGVNGSVHSDNTGGTGVLGNSQHGTGVFGTTQDGTGIAGVANDSDGYAAYFVGKTAFINGRVGIETDTPATELDVRGTIFTEKLGIGKSTPGAPFDVLAGFDGQTGPAEAIRISGPNTPANANSAQDLRWSFASAGSVKLRAYRGNSWDTYLQFMTNAAGQGSDVAQVRMHINENGRVGIATTIPDQTLTVNGDASKPGGGSWAVFSDERLKIMGSAFTRGLSALMHLKPLHYRYKPENELGITAEGDYVGFSAQAVEKLIPEAVQRNDQGYLLVNNDAILWTMLNGIKEQQGQIQRQQDQIEAQKAQIDELRRLVCKADDDARICGS